MLLGRVKQTSYSYKQETILAPTQTSGFAGTVHALIKHCFLAGEQCRALEDKPLLGLHAYENVSKDSFLPMQQNGLQIQEKYINNLWLGSEAQVF